MTQTDTTRLQRYLAFAHAHRFAVLLASLLLMFFYGPFVELFAKQTQPVMARVGIGTTFTLLLLAAVFTVSESRRSFRRAMWLAVPAVISELLDVSLFRSETHVIGHIVGAMFLVYVIFVLLKFIFTSERVTEDTIFASLCIYLLMAVLWALAYSLVGLYDADAFKYPLGDEISGNKMRFGAMPAGLEFYYSIVTMTTLGYGDILPISPIAKSLATLQAVVGQLYLAVLVARLVGLYVAEKARRRD